MEIKANNKRYNQLKITYLIIHRQRVMINYEEKKNYSFFANIIVNNEEINY